MCRDPLAGPITTSAKCLCSRHYDQLKTRPCHVHTLGAARASCKESY